MGAFPSTPAFDASPLHRSSIQIMTRGSASSRRHHDKTKAGFSNPRKRQGSSAATGKSAYRCSLVPTATTALLHPSHYRSRPQHNLHGVRTNCIVYVLACFSHRNGFPRDLLMRSTSRRFALEHHFASTVLWSLLAALVFQALVSR